MDEQRIQAYVELIEALLACPQGKEDEVLQAKAEPVDAGLLAVMEQYADWLESQGNSNAGWLRQFVAGLAQEIGLGEGSPSGSSSEDTAEFLVESMQLILQTQGNQAQVYEFFRANVERLDEALLQVLPDVFSSLIQQNDPELIAAVFGDFGNLIQQFPLGQHWLNLELGIRAYKQSLQVMTRDALPVEWAQSMMNLANAYRNRIRGDRAQNIEDAIAAFDLSLQVMTRDALPVEWAQSMMNLAIAYSERIQGDRAQNIEDAIAAYEQALQVMTRDALPVEWAQSMNNLALAYSTRIRGDRAQNIEDAISAYEQALQVRTRDALPVKWAQSMMNLANAYSDRIRGDRAQNIEDAISAYGLSLQVITRDAMPVEWATSMMNLANAYSDRIWGDRAQNSENAISAYELSLQVTTRDAMPVEWAQSMNNLALAYSERIRGDFPWNSEAERAKNIEDAIATYQAALTIFTPELLPNDCRKTGRNLGNLYLEQRRWTDAAATYSTVLQAAETLYQNANLLDSKSAELSENQTLFRNAAYAYARTKNLTQAITTLEKGRARGLSESLDRDRANLDSLKEQNESLYNQYQDITQQFRNLETQQRDRATFSDRHSLTPEIIRDTAKTLRANLETTIAQIRQVPSYENFLTPTKWEDIAIALRSDNPLIYIVTTSHGSMALIATVDAIDVLWLNNLTPEVLQKLLVGSGDIENLNGGWFVDYFQSAENRQTWLNTIESATHALWDLLMEPIVQQLKSKGYDRATLIPTGLLSLLPLHAAWTEDPTRPTGKRYALDDLHFTYTPNAKSLTAARAISDRPWSDSILAIDNPTQDLPNSTREIDCAVSSFRDRTVLRHEEATVEAVKAKLKEAAIVHFSCHGTANLNEPLNSGLRMHDSLLTLRDLLALNLTENNQAIRLAILSACETGLPGLDNIDEVVSLPIGLLQAGVAGVISSLWSVSDLSTMLLLTKFYDLWRDQKLPPDQALRQAQIWLRDTTNAEKANTLQAILPEFANHLRFSESTARFLYNELAFEDPDQRAYAHPFHWAAFSYTGI